MEEIKFPLNVNGYHFTSWNDAGRQLGYVYHTPIQRRYIRMKDTHSLEEIFVPKGTDTLFPLDVNGYHFTSWRDASIQLGYVYHAPIQRRYARMKDTHTLEEIFVPKVETESIFPLDVNGYHFTSWSNASRQLGYSTTLFRRRYNNSYSLMQVFGFSLYIIDNRKTLINEQLICHSKISDNLYKCKNKKTGLFELHTYDELNDMWRTYKGVKIIKEA